MNARIMFSLIAVGAAMPVLAMESLDDEQLSGVNGMGNSHLMFEDFQFLGTAIPGLADAGQQRVEAADGSSLTMENYRMSADRIGTYTSPLTLGLRSVDVTLNSSSDGNVTRNGTNLGTRDFLSIQLPELSAWQNVDVQYNAVYGNPTTPNPNNPNIRAGGTPSDKLDFALLTLDNIALSGRIDVAGIPEGYRIRSVYVDDGSQNGGSREGFMLNVFIDELRIDQWLFESEQKDGIYNEDRDMVIKDFRLTNLHLKGATMEYTPQGLRIAYRNPQPFTKDTGLLLKSGGGLPDTGHAAYDPSFPKANLTLTTQMPHALENQSRIQGVTLDHMVFNLRN